MSPGSSKLGVLLAVSLLFLSVPATPLPAPEGLREQIIAYLAARSPKTPRAIDVPPLGDFAVASNLQEDLKIDLSSHPQAKRIGHVPVTVTLSANGHILRRGVVNARVWVDVPVVIAMHPVRRGDPITAQHLGIEERDASELPNGWVENPEMLIGQRARRTVQMGSVWLSRWAETPPKVRRGQVVRLHLRSGPLRIEGKGVVRRDAQEGEWVRVVNADTKRELSGRVDANGAIHVEF